jgi:hypothetical protein
VERFWHIKIVFVLLFLPAGRWPHEWLKYANGCYIIRSHSYIHVHLLVFLKFYTSDYVFVCAKLKKITALVLPCRCVSRNVIKNSGFWDMTLYSLVERYHCYIGSYYLLNVTKVLADYVVLLPRNWYSSRMLPWETEILHLTKSKCAPYMPLVHEA